MTATPREVYENDVAASATGDARVVVAVHIGFIATVDHGWPRER